MSFTIKNTTGDNSCTGYVPPGDGLPGWVNTDDELNRIVTGQSSTGPMSANGIKVYQTNNFSNSVGFPGVSTRTYSVPATPNRYLFEMDSVGIISNHRQCNSYPVTIYDIGASFDQCGTAGTSQVCFVNSAAQQTAVNDPMQNSDGIILFTDPGLSSRCVGRGDQKYTAQALGAHPRRFLTVSSTGVISNSQLYCG